MKKHRFPRKESTRPMSRKLAAIRLSQERRSLGVKRGLELGSDLANQIGKMMKILREDTLTQQRRVTKCLDRYMDLSRQAAKAGVKTAPYNNLMDVVLESNDYEISYH